MRLTHVMPKTLFDRKLHATREKAIHAQKTRTAEVTICIILKRTARSPPTVTVYLETQVVEENVHGVRLSNVLLMVVRLDVRTELIHENNVPLPRETQFPRRGLPHVKRITQHVGEHRAASTRVLDVVTHVTVRIRSRRVRSTSEGVSRTRVIGRCRAWTGTNLALKTVQERDLSSTVQLSFQYLATLQKSRMGDTEKDRVIIRTATTCARAHADRTTQTNVHHVVKDIRTKKEREKARDFEPVRQRVVCAMKCGGAPSQPADDHPSK